MRSNQMLYPPNAVPFVLDPDAKARFIDYDSIAKAEYAVIAVCRTSFDEVLARHGAKSRRLNRVLEGGWHSIVGIELPDSRFGFLTHFESHPEEFNLHLQVDRRNRIFRRDYFLARELLAVPDAVVVVCDGPYLWA